MTNKNSRLRDVIYFFICIFMLAGFQSCNAEKEEKVKDRDKSVETGNAKTLHSFNGTDGDTPKGTMTLAGNTLFGFTSAGGQYNKGVIFSIDTSGSDFKALYNFEDGENNGTGNEPHHDAMLYYNNTLYGVTAYGGNGNNGVIFKINTDGSGYKPIHVFTGKKNDGSHPRSGVLELNSVFYGTTAEGGKDGKGVIYKINPDGSEFSILYSFVKSTGHNPHCRLTLGSDDHTVFGTTKTGGADGVGVVFAFDLSNSQYNVLHTFQKSNDNGYTTEHGFVTRSKNKLFGLTHFGGEDDKGVIYSLNEDGSDFKIIHSFGSDSKDGISPYGSLQLSNGYLYGTTQGGGKDDRGTIFRIDTSGSGYETILKYDKPTTGEYPIDNVVLNADGSMLYSFGQQGGEFAQTGAKKFGTIISLNLNKLKK